MMDESSDGEVEGCRCVSDAIVGGVRGGEMRCSEGNMVHDESKVATKKLEQTRGRDAIT